MSEHEAPARLPGLVCRVAPQNRDTPALAFPLHDAGSTVTFD
jgi:hypothetical protein